ncbi:Hypothetical protein PMT_2899 [Prochlorococcus marinus str. MIT 9313]|uniref:Uncharacterized protein n=1 Tax=Prochlorococcus marinus (strain MIT 9313) TaxID=74547 RepID=B9ESR3_PROMM|nr:hypothetical protein [Prochlorococcus marinus]CAX32417.1 Hypothetical protein PMT_2899 [Prochlorococcus marinus str. MIT 9313]
MAKPKKPEDGVKPEEGKVELSNEDLEGVDGGVGGEEELFSNLQNNELIIKPTYGL